MFEEGPPGPSRPPSESFRVESEDRDLEDYGSDEDSRGETRRAPERCRTRPSRRWSWLFLFLILPTFTSLADAISIDNDIIDEPDIECLEDSIRIWLKTRKLFAGRIYAKGRADLPECSRDDFAAERTKKPRFDLKFGLCGMKSLRSVDPRGMYYGITIVVSFHPLFITKVDQAFHVKCFFEEANRGLTAELGVSMIPTTEVEARHGIPGCSYSIHKSSIADLDAGRPAGPPIQFARVGDKVLHQWHCNDKMFGVLVRNCYVTDGFGKKAEVIDNEGCPVDPILITGIRYSADLQRGYAESQVFKFADKPGVWFFCQIQMCMKGHGMCRGVTPPSCASTAPPIDENRSIDYDNGSTSGGSKTTKTNRNNNNNRGGTSKRPKTKSPHNTNEYEDNTDKEESESEEEDGGGERESEESNDYESNSNSNSNFARKKLLNPSPSPEGDSRTSRDGGGTGAMGAYGRLPAAPEGAAFDDKENEETATVFGPGFTTDDFGLPTRVTSATETVTQAFETEDDLSVSKDAPTPPSQPIVAENNDVTGATKSPLSGSSDYNDYEEVTIPPNLTELLANLPDDVSADSIQKMFRDSVDDRRSLLTSMDRLKNQLKLADRKASLKKAAKSRAAPRRGDKIGSMTVDWRNTRRARDSPIPMDDDPNQSDTPMIAGQLMIYELDEEPPMEERKAAARLEDKRILDSDTPDAQAANGECAISRSGLLLLSGSLSAMVAALFVVTLFMYLRMVRGVDGGGRRRKVPPPLPSPDHLISPRSYTTVSSIGRTLA